MPNVLLDEQFNAKDLSAKLHWFCEPPSWAIDQETSRLRIATASESDFWQRTHYGFQADNGHFLYAEFEGDFTIETWGVLRLVHQYDQAGLMVRLSQDCWIKTSVEYEPDEPNKLGAVVTNAGYSDWSTQDVPDHLQEIGFRITRQGTTYKIEAAQRKDDWVQIRLCHLAEDQGQPIPAGLYACSPKEGGFQPEFDYLTVCSVDPI